MDQLRVPFLALAAFFLLLAFLVEIAAGDLLVKLTSGELTEMPTPGVAIRYLAILDGLLLYNMLWEGVQIIVPRGVSGRLQGPINLVVAALVLLFVLGLALTVFTLLTLMAALLLSVPFGTIAYMGAWGDFAEKEAAITLGLAMVLKLMFCLFLVLAHQRYLQIKSLVFLVCLSLGMTWLIGFVHAFLPGFLVSIGDAAVALGIAVIGAILFLLLVLTSVVATFKAFFSLPQS